MTKKSIRKMLEKTDKYIKTYPNWKMMTKVLHLVSDNTLTNMKNACEMLRIYPMELMDIVDTLEKAALIQSFNTTNDIGEKFTHFKGTKLGEMLLKYKTPLHRTPKLIRYAIKRRERNKLEKETQEAGKKQFLEMAKGRKSKYIF